MKAEATEVTLDGNKVKLAEALTTTRWRGNTEGPAFLVPLPIEALQFVPQLLSVTVKTGAHHRTADGDEVDDMKVVTVKPIFTDSRDDFEIVLQYLAFMTDLGKSGVTVFDVFSAIVNHPSVTTKITDNTLNGVRAEQRSYPLCNLLEVRRGNVEFDDELVWHLHDAFRVLKLLLSENKHVRDLTIDALSLIPNHWADEIDSLLYSIERVERRG
jgi:hypothetical protein